MSLQILYEDNHLIAVYKPAGTLVQSDITGDATLLDEVKYYLKTKYHKTGKVFLGLIHRLDRPVCGVILFAKTSKGASRLSEQFREHSVEKIYHALVTGRPPQDRGTIVHFLVKDQKKNKTFVHDQMVENSQRADLQYEVVKTNGTFSLLKIKLGTGRSHQIRSQLAAIGCPLVGDVKYGASSPFPNKSVALAATELRFTTATQGDEQIVSVSIPEEWQAYLS